MKRLDYLGKAHCCLVAWVGWSSGSKSEGLGYWWSSSPFCAASFNQFLAISVTMLLGAMELYCLLRKQYESCFFSSQEKLRSNNRVPQTQATEVDTILLSTPRCSRGVIFF